MKKARIKKQGVREGDNMSTLFFSALWLNVKNVLMLALHYTQPFGTAQIKSQDFMTINC